MAIILLGALVGVPYLVIVSTWGWLAELWHAHPIWCVILVVPICAFAVQVMRWAIQVGGALALALGGLLDKLEKVEPT